jgi:hypothetical protein
VSTGFSFSSQFAERCHLKLSHASCGRGEMRNETDNRPPVNRSFLPVAGLNGLVPKAVCERIMSMSRTKPTEPRAYNEWRADRRDEDAAYTFAYYLIKHCRNEVLERARSASLPGSPDELRELLTKTVDHSLHNVMDLLEGFFQTNAGQENPVQFALKVQVYDAKRKTLIEEVPLSPCLLDLPIGYWKWAGGEFR